MNTTVLNLFNNPKFAGRISKPSGIAENINLDGTFHVEFSIKVESNIITDVKFRAQANPYIIAVCETIASMVKNKMVNMLLLDEFSVKSALGDENDIDINFCIECIKMAVSDYFEKLEKSSKQKA